eukprot:4233828-Amphidinium_carterae.1
MKAIHTTCTSIECVATDLLCQAPLWCWHWEGEDSCLRVFITLVHMAAFWPMHAIVVPPSAAAAHVRASLPESQSKDHPQAMLCFSSFFGMHASRTRATSASEAGRNATDACSRG